jgi:lysophospholipid acyltransferase (LPLAT)-like uncharacterized protein
MASELVGQNATEATSGEAAPALGVGAADLVDIDPRAAVRSDRLVHRLWIRLVGTLAAWGLRLWSATMRRDTAEIARIDRLLQSGERVLAIFWHGKFFPLFPLLAGRRTMIFASLSFRGRVITEICRRFGYDCVLLPDGGGKHAHALIRAALTDHQAGGFAVDGPLGPYHVIKRGVVEAASEFGFVLLPVSVAMSRAWVDRRRWDLRETPLPFTSIALAVGDPIAVPRSLGRGEAAAIRAVARAALEQGDERAAERLRRMTGGRRL